MCASSQIHWPQQAVRVRGAVLRHNPQDGCDPSGSVRTRFRRVSVVFRMVQTPWRTCRRGRTCRTGSRRSSSSTAGAHTLTRTDVRQPYAVRSLRGSRIVPLVQPPPHALSLSSYGAEVRDTGWLCSHHIPPVCQTQKNLRQGPVMQEEIPFTPSLHLHRLVDRQIGRFVEPLIERWSVLTAPVTRAMLRGRP